MMVVGITGGIGSGKSIVCNIFRQLGVAVYDADAAAKNLYETEPEIIDTIKKEFPGDIIDKKGKIEKHKLASLVFQDESALKKLNRIVHPYVKKHFEEWAGKQSAPYIIKEAAILFESGSDKGCNKKITVIAPVETRIQRTMQRDKRSKAEVEQIISRQWNDEEKIKRSDFVIVNDDQQMVIPQVLDIHSKLLALEKS